MIILDEIAEVEVSLYQSKINPRYGIFINDTKFTSGTLLEIAKRVKWLIYFRDLNVDEMLLRIKIDEVLDMPSISVFEYLVYMLLEKTDLRIKIQVQILKNSAMNVYFTESLLNKYNFTFIDKTVYLKYFSNTYKVNDRGHFRQSIVSANDRDISLLSQDIVTFLLGAGVNNEELRLEIAEVVAELGTNMKEHSKSDFITEIHVNNSIENGKFKREKGKLISITVYNISEIKLYTGLHNLIQKNELVNEQRNLYTALDYHKKFFDEKYTLNHFLIISTFQRYISSRKGESKTSGTGLTRILESIIDILDDDPKKTNAFSYVLSGKDVVYLNKDFIKESIINNNKQIGFNESGRYLDDIPLISSIDYSKIYYNGTSFYFRLFLKERKNL